MLSTRLVRSAVLCAALAVGATACGSKGAATTAAAPASASASAAASGSPSPSPSATGVSGMTGSQIIDQAETAMTSLQSMRMVGTVASDGQKITIDLSIDKDQNCTGSMDFGSTGTVQLVHTGTRTWMKPDMAFWKNIAAQQGDKTIAPAVAARLKGHWLSGGQDDPDLKSMADMCSIGKIFGDTDKPTGATKGETTTVNGTGAVAVKATMNGDPGTLYVATQGQPYVLREASDGSDPGSIDFSDFNKPVVVQTPPANLVINTDSLGKQLQSA